MVCEQVASLDIPNNPRDAYKGLVQVLGLAWIQSSLMLFFCPFLHIVLSDTWILATFSVVALPVSHTQLN